MKNILVCSAAPNASVAKKIAQALIQKKLAACVHITAKVTSFYWWQGKIEKAREVQLVIKTQRKLFPKVTQVINKLHPYKVPEVFSLRMDQISQDYATWLWDVLSLKK